MLDKLRENRSFRNATKWPIRLIRVLIDEDLPLSERLALIPYIIPPYGLR